MSETSSDAESSCGWTIISNEGSDIEALGLEAAVEYGAQLLERPPVEKAELQVTQASAAAGCDEERDADLLDDTLEERTEDETLLVSEDRDGAAGKEPVTLLTFSDHSDIVTLGDLKEDEHADGEEEVAANAELYLGTSCSSQYAFTAAETVFPVQQPAVTNSSSSEDEAGQSPSNIIRRRRVRKNTSSIVTEPEEEALESGPSEEMEEDVDKEEKQQEEDEEEKPAEVGPAVDVGMQGQGSSVLNKCILLALLIAFIMSFGQFYGTVQIQERRKIVKNIGVNELDIVRDLLQQHVREQPLINQAHKENLKNLDEQNMISLLTDVIEKMKKENQEINIKQKHIQAQRKDLQMLLHQKAEEKTKAVAQQQKLAAENQQLKSSLAREEKSLSTLQDELRNLRSKIIDLETMGAGADSLLSENQRLEEQLEEEKQQIQNIHVQREGLKAEAQTLRKKLDKERKVTDELRRELNLLRSQIPIAGKEAGSEGEELQSRLLELEERLSFEQQRSDLWERLYLETKEERAKGDTESKVKKPKKGMAGKVKETFDAVKNSTKEFVHHHKEQIKKAKQAVNLNLRKFSDSVKSTFRNFKDSASTLINKARGFYTKRRDERNSKESWQHRSNKPHHRQAHQTNDFFHSSHNTRKYEHKVHEDQGPSSQKANLKGCSGVFDCAYQESMSLFNKAMEPIKADEFHQLLQSFLQQEVDHFHHWKELELFVNNFFHNGVFIHDQMLFTDFVSGVEDYLADMHEYQGLHDDTFGDLDDFVFRHLFGEVYTKRSRPSGPFERPDTDSKEETRSKHHQRKQQKARPRGQSERKWSRSGRNTDRHMADVKIELGPLPFDPKY
ncbi:cell cycle progression protein 1 isoform X3 [Platichthys flesus]|uniref:cell cycle progression protein 1 isoform X3 n=1 Tax=Platichthys flesus TaxID=8260 RepID=UPI002DBA9EF2|nr:cell cycle progression protein 1 isoform X3 [Platichthys flesus]